MPGEHDVIGNDFETYLGNFKIPHATAGGWASWDAGGVHYVVLLNVFNFENMGLMGADQLDWLAKDLAGVARSTPVVVFTHVPLYALYPQWGWTTEDGTKALAMLQRFDRVTVLSGHIHQIVTHQEGNIRFASADSTAYPQPKPGTAPKPGPVTLTARRPLARDRLSHGGTRRREPAVRGSRVSLIARDEALECAFERGDTAAFETAFARYGARLFTTALRVLGDAELARECVQDVFLQLWRKTGSYVIARGSLEAFLVVCVRNRALMRVRSRHRGNAALRRLRPQPSYTLEEDPIERDRIGRAVAELSEPQATVVQLAYYRGLTLREISEELAIPLGTVKTRLSGALRALRQSLVVEIDSER